MGTGLRRGLKQTSSHFGAKGGATRTESYSYDNDLDYLVAANYGDGLPSASVTWGYDAAGNRVSDSAQPGSWTYDNLNRMTSSPGFTYYSDILGNRTQRVTSGFTQDQSIQWDPLNRMIEMNRPPVNGTYQRWNYAYRADGMRTTKTHVTATAAGGPTTTQSRTSYRYDGQMGIEDLDRDGSGAITGVTRTGLGARSVEVISKTTSSGNTLTYPLYDIHGNMVAALSKAGSTFSVGEARTYDAWGQVRSQVGSDGKLRYCGNLGHKQDDESGLIYMRARYYEPSSGRFACEDVKGDGGNWFVYGHNNPISVIDPNGKEGTNEGFTNIHSHFSPILGIILMAGGAAADKSARLLSLTMLAFLCVWWTFDLRGATSPNDHKLGDSLIGSMLFLLAQCLTQSSAAGKDAVTSASPVAKVIAVAATYAGFLSLFMELEGLAGAHPGAELSI